MDTTTTDPLTSMDNTTDTNFRSKPFDLSLVLKVIQLRREGYQFRKIGDVVGMSEVDVVHLLDRYFYRRMIATMLNEEAFRQLTIDRITTGIVLAVQNSDFDFATRLADSLLSYRRESLDGVIDAVDVGVLREAVALTNTTTENHQPNEEGTLTDV